MFEIRQCTHPDCGLRLPIDLAVHRGDFCPRCGAPLTQVAGPFQHRHALAEARPKRKVSVLLDNIRSVHNTGAIFRTADGAGLTHIYLCGITPNPADHPAIQKTSLGAELEIPWTAHPDACVLGQNLRDSGHRLLALETTPRAVSLFELDLAAIEAAPILLVLGNEQAGIDPGVLDLCDLVLAVPMVGTKASLNVAIAFGVAAYWLNFS
jgi:23S rRNA (guanosine2251-2'-O)-methyltransferase